MKTNLDKNWLGTRGELLNLIIDLENSDPDLFLLHSKGTGKAIPVSSRRIQQFMDEAIIPKGISKFEVNKKGNYYTYKHVVRYLAAIRLRKSGQPINQISILMNKLTFSKLESYVFAEKKDFGKIFDHVDLKYDDYKGKIKTNLIKLGREKGNVLKISSIKLAITPWCSVYINEDKLKMLNDENIETLTFAFADTLKQLKNEKH